METYKGYINEFVDWVSGEDTSQQESEERARASSTNGLPVSGGSIRELLQTKLKKPFVYYEDTKAGLYRLFSGESTRDKWIRMNTEGSAEYDPDASTKLELFSFVRPTDVSLTQTGLDANPKYIIAGDSTSSAADLKFYVTITPDADSFTVTYDVQDSTGVKHTFVEARGTEFSNGITPITKNIYEYLTVGQNTVTVTARATNSSARTSISFPIYLISFELSSSFNYANHWDPTKPLEVPISVKRSDTALTLQVDAYVDGNLASFANTGSAATWTVNNNETNPTTTFNINNVYSSNNTSTDHNKHVLKIEAKLYDQNTGVEYHSNVLFFDFVVASSVTGITNRFVNTAYTNAYNKISTVVGASNPVFSTTQYEPFTLNWAYYTDRETTEQVIDINWVLRIGTSQSGYTYTQLATIQGSNNNISEPLRFIPDFSTDDNPVYLVAMYNGSEIDAFPLIVAPSTLSIVETGGYNLKLSAYGKSNSASDRDIWDDSTNNITTTFSGIVYDNNSGWNNDAFVTSGINSYATVNYCPMPQGYDLASYGKTIEIEFKPQNVVNEDDVVICIGDPEGGHIDITTNRATVFDGTRDVVHTNFKANEKIKLAFVFNPIRPGNVDSNLVFIINNGILERANGYGTAQSYISSNGNIKIGGSESGVCVYNIRAYDKALTYTEELNNYIYDADNKAEILSRNNIVSSSVIDYNLVQNKIDTVLITGNLDDILNQDATKKDSESTVNFSRTCISDATKNFSVTNGKIRKHGQSTLNYPITSMKIWTNKAKEDDIVPTIVLSDQQRAEGFNKNRYQMKTGAIPSNKFVLQANYADSSGTHNGALLRLIQNTWYNARIGDKYILRTAPQLFATGKILVHDDADLGEDGTWVEGYGNGQRAIYKGANDTALRAHTWTEIAGKDFPYIIRNAPDSFPCAVFYRNGENTSYNFLGQYVFMDDKKSDYVYGERSIYYFGDGTDPFVLKTENTKNGVNGKQDKKENCVWDNKDVLRVEVVLPNTTLTSYMDFYVPVAGGNPVPCTNIKYNDAGKPEQYYWEDYFEIIYPDSDDIEEDDAKDGLTKFDANSKFVSKATPFIQFLRWITDCKQNYNKTTDWWNAGQYSSTQQAFQATAAQHLDMYKLAAYYIFFLRFGLVDSVERNAQLKTYDGQHWHYEPWDMDIALGNTNQGALVLDPPLSRNTFEPGTTTYAYSGKSATTSNVLWDCLEAWDYWANTIVPNVAQALYEQGLDYDTIIQLFDEEYANKWSETMYNESGHFKYVQSGGSDWLAWLQGSRTSHRHWWLSTSMNYYDAKWSCGSFNEHRIRLFADKDIHNVGTDIVTIKPTSSTFFKMAQQEGKTSLGTLEATRNNPAIFDVSQFAFSAKDPSYIYGGTFVEEINLSCFAEKLKAADFSLCFDNVLGAPIKSVNVGVPYTVVNQNTYSGKVSGTQMRLTAYDANTGNDAFENLKVLDITGQSTITTTSELLSNRDRKNVTDFYAIGSGITEFISSQTGNKFNTIKFPGVTTTTYTSSPTSTQSLQTIVMVNSSWNNIEFWNAAKSGDVVYERDDNNEIVTDDEGNPVILANNATFTRSSIPSQLRTVQFIGSTASNACAGQLLLSWIDSIDNSLPAGHTEEDLYNILKTKNFTAENINWTSANGVSISYKDLARIAQFNGGAGNNTNGTIKGYIMLSDTTELTAVQLNNLTEWFGASVFTKSAKNSSLVVDQNLNYTRITFSGTETINGQICLREGNMTAVNATKFLLSETDQSEVQWTLSAINPTSGASIISTEGVLSARLYKGDDGVQYIIADENGTYDDGNGGYDLTVTVTISGVSQSQVVRIIAATVPETMSITCSAIVNKTGRNARKFYIDSFIESKSSVFTGKVRDSWVLFEAGQQVEFYPTFDITPGQNGVASIKNVQFVVNRQYTVSREDVSGQQDTILNRVVVDRDDNNSYMYYTKSATHGGIILGIETIPDEMRVVDLQVDVIIGEKRYSKTLNIIAYDDALVLHKLATSIGVQNTLVDAFNVQYGNNTAPSEFYKSDLFSISGTLDFSAHSNAVGTVLATNGNPLLQYLPNITGLNFTNCTSVKPTSASFGSYNSSTRTTTFIANQNIVSVSFSGCDPSDTAAIDFSQCPNLESVNMYGTKVGVVLGSQNKVNNLILGTPYTVSITNPTVLGDDNATTSIQGSENLQSIRLINVNTSSVHGFNMFNTLYNPS